jgi:branched-chain amino acid transport system ATP-binding protein
MTILSVEKIKKHFSGLQVLNEASLNVDKGKIVGLVGPNGSGKTTLLQIIFGLLKPDAGNVIFHGKPITGMAPYRVYREGLSFSFQLPRLFSRLSVLDNLLMGARDQEGESVSGALFMRGRWQRRDAELTDKALTVLGLLELVPLASKPAGELSGGQRKLVEVGRALMADPTMILLDEPAAGVNPVLGQKIYEKLRNLSQRGLSILVVEHKLDIMMDFADWIYMMDMGKVLLSGTPKEVLENPVFYTTYVGEKKDVTSGS